YTYTRTGISPCANSTATVAVTVNPAVNAGTSSSITLCSVDAPVNLYDLLGVSAQTGGTWTPAGLSGGYLGTYTPGTNTATIYTYTVSGTAPCADATVTVEVTETPATPWYADADNDGAGDPNDVLYACTMPSGYVDNSDDGCPGDVNKVAPGQCGCGVEDIDTDEDGVADCVDGCPLDDNKTDPGNCGCGNPDPGAACDDGDNTTGEDTVQPDCTCAGVPVDCNYVVNGTDLPGTSCDDGNPDTWNDTWSNDCLCEGQLEDCAGVTGGSALPGTTCDDGDANTGNDVYYADCTCVGEVIDCLGVPGGSDLPGSPCDDGNANTANDEWDANCECTGTPSGCQENEVTLELGTDNAGHQTSWEIVPSAGGSAVCAGDNYPNASIINETRCLPDGCYRLLVYDSFNDGMGTGGYRLLDHNGDRIIDNWQNGAFGGMSAIANNGAFCLPLGTDRMQAGSCDVMNLIPTSVVAAEPNPAVSAQLGLGSNTDDGYQFWIYNPNGGYSRTIFKSITNPGQPGLPYGATAPAFLKLSSLTTLPVPTNVKLNIKVRSRVNGVYANYGPACSMMVDVLGNCPTTSLINAPNDPKHSCGVTGKVVSPYTKLYCYLVDGANKYQWRFENTAHSYVRTIASANAVLALNPWSTQPLLCGTNTYNVTVHASFDNGATYCPYGSTCTVGITNNTSSCTSAAQGGGGQQSMQQENGGMQLWPNPAREGIVTLELAGLSSEARDMHIVVMDLFGKTLVDERISTDGAEEVSTTLTLGNDIASGLYLVNVTSGSTTWTERLMVE
ncbi:MAG: T9SS type A sorting domain-containing protein, partial [Flavobacteriales bacterium]